MKNLNQLERIGLANKVTDIITENVGDIDHEEWWAVRADVTERCLAWSDGNVEKFTKYVVGGWCSKGKFNLTELAWEWARQAVMTWDLQYCIDYAGQEDMFDEPTPNVCHDEVREMSYRSKAWIKYRDQIDELWYKQPKRYKHIWEPMTPYNVVYNQVLQLLTECSQ